MTNIEIRPIRLSEANSTIALVLSSFDEFIAPDYSAEGIDRFHAEVTADSLESAIHDNEIVLIAMADSELAGVIKVRDKTHISWLFVDKAYHTRGIGKELVIYAAAEIQNRTPDAKTITLNSSPFALPVYIRMGFVIASPEKEIYGMRMTPVQANIEVFRQ